MKAIRVVLLAASVCICTATAETYTVKTGDTLYKVARQFNLDPVELAAFNGLSSPTIQVGQTLQLPADAAPSAPAGAASKPGTAASRTAATNAMGVVRAAALRFLGLPYRLGATGQGAIDCSAFTRAVMQQIGINLPRTAREQYGAGTPVARGELRAGDLVFFNTLGNGISHVGVYLGNDQFAHANSYLGRSVIEKLSDVYYRFRYVGARRVLPSG